MSGALVAREIPAFPNNLEADVEGDIEQVDKMFVLSRVRLRYRFAVPPGKREAAERALAVYERGCPVYQSLRRGIDISWSADIREE